MKLSVMGLTMIDLMDIDYINIRRTAELTLRGSVPFFIYRGFQNFIGASREEELMV